MLESRGIDVMGREVRRMFIGSLNTGPLSLRHTPDEHNHFVRGETRGDDMRRLSEEQWQSLASALQRAMTRVVPDWTAHNTHDPGITVLELLSYALTDLQYRTDTIDANGRVLARRVARLADSLAGVTGTDDCPPGLQRVNYFYGKLLGVDEFTAEQDYLLGNTHRRNRALHGAGVVTGLSVTLERTSSSAQVIITPGLAFNPCGEEIEVCGAHLVAATRSRQIADGAAALRRATVPPSAGAQDPQADLQARFSRSPKLSAHRSRRAPMTPPLRSRG